MTTFDDAKEFISEEAWPAQRLRMGWALVFFYFFEVHIGKSLPQVMPILALGMGIACLVSATAVIRKVRLNARIAHRVNDIDRSW